MITNQSNARLARAWLLLLGAATVHVLDEWLTGFVPFFNEMSHKLGERSSFWPTPTFTLTGWLVLVGVALALGCALTLPILRGNRIMRIVAGIVAILMTLNACLHLLGSLYVGHLLPGFWSSPLLLAAAIYLAICRFSTL